MKIYALATALVLSAGMLSPAFASCDVKKADEDKQAKCAEKCDDNWLNRSQNYDVRRDPATLEKVKEEKKACDAACGCAENTKF